MTGSSHTGPRPWDLFDGPVDETILDRAVAERAYLRGGMSHAELRNLDARGRVDDRLLDWLAEGPTDGADRMSVFIRDLFDRHGRDVPVP